MRNGAALALLRPPAAFTPARHFAAGIDGAWWEARSMAAANAMGTAIASLTDLSGLGRHATQGTGANQPVLSLDAAGFYYLAFDGTNDQLSAAWAPSAYPVTMIIACRFTSTGSGVMSLSQSASVYKNIQDNGDTGHVIAVDRNVGFETSPTSNVKADGPNVYLVEFGSAAFTMQSNLDAVGSAANTNAFGTPTKVVLGSYTDAGSPFEACSIYGAAAFATTFNNEQKRQLLRYFSALSGARL